MFDFCGIGNACVDIVADVDDHFLRDWGLEKGICTYLSLDRADRLEQALPKRQYIPGGCAANIAACISALGGKASFIGRIADDSIGAMFRDDTKKLGIHFTAKPDPLATTGSTRIFVLITPDSERTFAAFYGVQEDISESDLDIPAIETSTILYLDGYALNSRAGDRAFSLAADIAHRAGHMVALSPNDLSILTKYRGAIDELAKKADIFLCNEAEALFYTNTKTLDDAIAILQSRFSIGAITLGQQGVYAFDHDHPEALHLPAAPVNGPVIDTNGAGDNFAAGFLYGLGQGFSLEKSATLGNLCAAAIITVHGARPVTDYKPFLTQLT